MTDMTDTTFHEIYLTHRRKAIDGKMSCFCLGQQICLCDHTVNYVFKQTNIKQAILGTIAQWESEGLVTQVTPDPTKTVCINLVI